MSKPKTLQVVCCAQVEDPDWRWLEPHLTDLASFHFMRCAPRTYIEKRVRLVDLAALRGAYDAVQLAKKIDADILVAHGPTLAAWCSIFGYIFSLQASIQAHNFNFTKLPGTTKTFVFSLAYKAIDRFVVFSRIERTLYAKSFKLNESRFDFVHWSVKPPEVTALKIAEHDSYVSAIGGNARDYETLMSAASRMPDIPFVLVVRPSNLAGLNIPPNVTSYVNLSLSASINILFHSRFMILPLINSDVPCGHVTMVAAMHLGKAMVVTASKGVSDYAQDGVNSLTVEARKTDDLIFAIRRIWNDRDLSLRLGENGRRFAASNCTEETLSDHFRGLLTRHQSLHNK